MIRNELHWLTVHKRIVYKLCLLVFKCQLRAATNGDLDFPRTRTVTYIRLTGIRGFWTYMLELTTVISEVTVAETR